VLHRWPWFVAILALLSAGTTAAAVRADHDRPASASASASAKAKAKPVAEWDRRVLPLVRFVEQERRLRFKNPVRTEFLSDKAFRKAVTADEAPTPSDERERHHLEGIFRALGLVEGKLDLDQATDTLAGEEVIGLYDPDTDRILIRGDRVTLPMRPTIVHELTHALQAQHFDLERDPKVSGQETAFTSLVEADAMRIEDRYIGSLSDADQDRVDAADQAQAEGADLDGVPPILSELFSLPYALGPPFIDAVASDGGDAAINKAFEHPPVTEEQIIDAAAYLAGDKPAKVATPAVPKGGKQVGPADDFGMVSLLLVLGERLPFNEAWTAVEGWAGDASVGYRQGGRDCIAVRVLLDSDDDAGQLEAATRSWADGRPRTSVTRRNRTITFSSCDPGTSATTTAAPGRPRTFELLQLRVELVASLEQSGADRGQAACVTNAVFAEHDPASLLAVAQLSDEQDPRLVKLQRDVAATTRRCGASGTAG
jgi:hypothetical protein